MDGLILLSGYVVGGVAGLIGGSIFMYFFMNSPYGKKFHIPFISGDDPLA